jgi:hypothetical protein
MTNEVLKVDIVLVDNTVSTLCEMADHIRKTGRIVDIYRHPSQLLENLSKYDKNIRIVMGYIFDEMRGSKINGIKLAERLHEAGYSDLHMFTYSTLKWLNIPLYLRAISKIGNDYDALLEGLSPQIFSEGKA